MRTAVIRILAGAALFWSVAAAAQQAWTTRDTSVRAGPDNTYPPVATLAGGYPVDVLGCLSDYSWCDVVFNNGYDRGWVPSRRLQYMYQSRRVPLYDYSGSIGLPIISFSLHNYWDDHYRGRSWYRDRPRWQGSPHANWNDRRGDGWRDRRDGYRDGRRDADRDGRRDGNRDGRRDGDRDGRRDGDRDGRRDGDRDGRRDGWRDGPRDRPNAVQVRPEQPQMRPPEQSRPDQGGRDGGRDGNRDGGRDGNRDGRRGQQQPQVPQAIPQPTPAQPIPAPQAQPQRGQPQPQQQPPQAMPRPQPQPQPQAVQPGNQHPSMRGRPDSQGPGQPEFRRRQEGEPIR